jgi:hypothetical protein
LGVGTLRALRSGGELVNLTVARMPDWALKLENMMEVSKPDMKSENVKIEMPST